ncbi:lyase family protein [Picrophilus oshimae]|uniref:Argininosuccinate lyase n=1 Tax=Picrophilus torridus (strain ATCC 700027 / DSM 9790 / JCM 10055 / NBRC 100828 / KAW 2/3) TaxID=1122961 RepID=Q6L1N6_PICTO|nr:lyase family protein [Picrophilus oshimae]AAT43116.1 argininosuccinate lyase [Picrophilus oshimae DSM 9789]SMD30576.1 argininosuccinate lyase [Picrophilus oshimae DSM 9789]
MKIWSGSAGEELENKFYDNIIRDDIDADKNMIKYEIINMLAYNVAMKAPCSVIKALLDIYKNGIELKLDLEDVHGNIEDFIIRRTGFKNFRMFLSRNEQVHSDLNLFIIDKIIEIEKILYEIIKVIPGFNGRIPGYTHYRQAMPMSVNTYINYIKSIFYHHFNNLDSFLMDLREMPLGYGSGYGSFSPVDFNQVSNLLNMEKNIKNPVYSSLRYIKNIENIVYLISSLAVDISRICQDIIIYSENDIITIPPEYTTGSSLMPNKINPDYLELFQGISAESISMLSFIMQSELNKTTGYHRDFQIVKDRTISFINNFERIMLGLKDLLYNIKFNEKNIKNDVYATYNAWLAFKNGMDWKSAYSYAGNKIKNGEVLDEYQPGDLTDYIDVNELNKRLNHNIKIFIEPREKLIAYAENLCKNI